MFLRKSLRSLQIIPNRQKCLNWCQIVVNRRYLSKDSDHNNDNEDKSLDKVEPIREQDHRKSEDSVVIAKQNLNQLIDNLKNNTVFGESDNKLKEMLAKPKFHIRKSAKTEVKMDNKKNETINEISDQIDKRLVMAAKGIASTLSGEQSKKTENDLLKLLKLQVLETNLAKEGKPISKQDLSSLLSDMKVIKEDSTEDKSFASLRSKWAQTQDTQQRHFGDSQTGADIKTRGKRRQRFEDKNYEQSISHSFMNQRNQRSYSEKDIEQIELFTGEDIGIFDPHMKDSTDSPKMFIWDRLKNDELEYIIAQPPKNAFEEMIQWTEEGKLWRYPINNEQGLEREEKVPFYEHVLLDHLLDGFPQTGPIRKFMELVIMGLSSNPYITVERKHATVDYYRQYFKEREDMLQLADALA